jgi:prepilin-type N-terminal cleavage/methylation domain-containing protein
VAKKKIGFMPHNNAKHLQPAFTLLEVLFVILIIGVFSSMIIPNFAGRGPRYEREQFIARLNAITQFAWQQAIAQHKLHTVEFDFEKRRVHIEVADDVQPKKGELKKKPITDRLGTSFVWPAQLEIKQFFIEHVNEMSGRKIKSAYFVIMPQGLTQEVIINLFDIKDTIDNRPRKVGLVLNPFSAQFSVYDTFQE